jgi:hypothetical protein
MQAALRFLALAVLFSLALQAPAHLLADGLAEKIALLEQQQQGSNAEKQLPLTRTKGASPAPADAAADAELHDYELHGIAKQHKSSKGSYDKACPAGCEAHGNCNRALGRWANDQIEPFRLVYGIGLSAP